MVEVRIASLSVDSMSNQPVIVLGPVETDEAEADRRLIPIWIGQNEATAILLALQDVETPRPMTHDLLLGVITSLGRTVERVEITRLDEGTFYAALILRGDGAEVAVDARPSDSIALAVRARCPIFCSEAVLDEAGILPQVYDESEEGGPDPEEELRRFREFLDGIEPSDFQ